MPVVVVVVVVVVVMTSGVDAALLPASFSSKLNRRRFMSLAPFTTTRGELVSDFGNFKSFTGEMGGEVAADELAEVEEVDAGICCDLDNFSAGNICSGGGVPCNRIDGEASGVVVGDLKSFCGESCELNVLA